MKWVNNNVIAGILIAGLVGLGFWLGRSTTESYEPYNNPTAEKYKHIADSLEGVAIKQQHVIAVMLEDLNKEVTNSNIKKHAYETIKDTFIEFRVLDADSIESYWSNHIPGYRKTEPDSTRL